LLACCLVGCCPYAGAVWVTWPYAPGGAGAGAAADTPRRAAARLHPTDATIQFNLGCYACQRGELGLARARVDRAIALDGKYADLAGTDPDLAALRE
jgi:hypothetical protein